MRRNTTRPSRLRRWWFTAITVLCVAGGLLVLTMPPRGPAAEPVPPPTVTAPQESELPSPSSTAETATAAPAVGMPDGAPSTTDFRKLAVAAATAIYTWDTRSASYSDVYSRLRGWWHVLPDGSNPLSVLVQEFEATGINAGSYATLAGQQAQRSATVQSLMCDDELAEVREHPAPWFGLHVCTVSLWVVDESTSGRNRYAATASVMVNCPPASTAPPDRCVMVGFYASPSRIVS
ncbi:hypothetical protein [Arthrobacter sp. Soil762]|uniref:hypothetical protein n=1 Tax=Arthrobacter sp. Soil762 TaxID=1736401 RepID=UPI0012E3F242|nr:hypothetical protein [Arthrobacter sp. Soil762]